MSGYEDNVWFQFPPEILLKKYNRKDREIEGMVGLTDR